MERTKKGYTMIVHKEIDFNTPLTKEQIKMLNEMETSPIVFDDDSPELSEEELQEFKHIS